MENKLTSDIQQLILCDIREIPILMFSRFFSPLLFSVFFPLVFHFSIVFCVHSVSVAVPWRHSLICHPLAVGRVYIVRFPISVVYSSTHISFIQDISDFVLVCLCVCFCVFVYAGVFLIRCLFIRYC